MFDVANAALQNDPDESADAMGNRPDGLIVSQAGHYSAIYDLKNASFDLTAALAD